MHDILVDNLYDGKACLDFRPILADSLLRERESLAVCLKKKGMFKWEDRETYNTINCNNKMASNVKGKDNILPYVYIIILHHQNIKQQQFSDKRKSFA